MSSSDLHKQDGKLVIEKIIYKHHALKWALCPSIRPKFPHCCWQKEERGSAAHLEGQ